MRRHVSAIYWKSAAIYNQPRKDELTETMPILDTKSNRLTNGHSFGYVFLQKTNKQN